MYGLFNVPLGFGLTGQLMMFMSIYYAPLHLAVGRPHTVTVLVLPYLMFHFFLNNHKHFFYIMDLLPEIRHCQSLLIPKLSCILWNYRLEHSNSQKVMYVELCSTSKQMSWLSIQSYIFLCQLLYGESNVFPFPVHVSPPVCFELFTLILWVLHQWCLIPVYYFITFIHEFITTIKYLPGAYQLIILQSRGF